MHRREGEKRVEPAERVEVAMARARHPGEVDIGVGEPWAELERFARHRLCPIVFALVVQQIGKITIGLSVIWLELESCGPARFRFRC